ncbi:MAG: hypothetical protein K0Q72_1429 [Armatimonadetes bacterium]|nr:hypothetical protein [Armatimonadota bacterium]
MISIKGNTARLCDGVTRRDFVRVGALGTLGLGLPQLLQAEAMAAEIAKKSGKPGKSPKNCILFFLMGGQSQLDMWDMKPDAPEMIRGEFKPIGTNVPGIQICEHLPQLAKRADKFAIIRSMTHHVKNHAPAGYYALSGMAPKRDVANFGLNFDDYPALGSVVSMMSPATRQVPSYVQLSPGLVGDTGIQMPGLHAAVLGPQYDPLKVMSDPNDPRFQVEELSLPQGVNDGRLTARRSLLKIVEDEFPLIQEAPGIERMGKFYQRAFNLVTSPEARKAFDINQESPKLRDRYGRNIYAQQLLLARRLVESGVRLVTIVWGGAINMPADFWDTHQGNFPKQKDHLLPAFDQCYSALLDDLTERGMIDDTLVVAMGEFGRTPRVGQITANGGTDSTGRDHWPFCYSITLAGAGIRTGQVIGKSDETTSTYTERPVTPEDLAATVYHAMGIDYRAEMHDQLKRPLPIVRDGHPVYELWGSRTA